MGCLSAHPQAKDIDHKSASFCKSEGVDEKVNYDRMGQEIIDEEDTRPPWARPRNSLDAIWVHPDTEACLFVGDAVAASSRDMMTTNGISCIVVCLEEGRRGSFEGDAEFMYFHFPIALWRKAPRVHTTEGIVMLLAPLIGFVSDALGAKRNVLIHCLAGAHRAGTAGIACLMHLGKMDSLAATQMAKSKRMVIDPIADLKTLLTNFDKACNADVMDAVNAARERGFTEACQALFPLCVGNSDE